MYFNYIDQDLQNDQENYSNIEHFMVPPLQNNTDERFRLDPNVPEDIRNTVIPSELSSVIEKFDLDPGLLTEKEKILRIKYLELSIKIINDSYDKRKDEFMKSDMWNSLTIEQKMVWNTNIDSFKVLTLRIVKLLIKELDPPVKCPDCPVCPSCPPPPTCPTCATCPTCPTCESCPTCAPTPTCPTCQEPPSTRPYTVGMVVLLIIIVVLLYLFFSK
jgi:hypothetical protein